MTNKHLYPNDWPLLRAQCLERAEYQCEHCGIEDETPARSERTGRPYIVYLHAAHKNHDKLNPSPELIALCPSCHGRYDYAYRERERRFWLERFKHRTLLARAGLQAWYNRRLSQQ